jgi:hypothetical protein
MEEKNNIINFILYNEFYSNKVYNILLNKGLFIDEFKILNSSVNDDDNTITNILKKYNITDNYVSLKETIKNFINEKQINKILIKKYKLKRSVAYEYLTLLLLLELYNSNKISSLSIDNLKKNINEKEKIIKYSESIDDIPIKLIEQIDPNDVNSYQEFIKNHYNTDCLTNLKIVLSLNNNDIDADKKKLKNQLYDITNTINDLNNKYNTTQHKPF